MVAGAIKGPQLKKIIKNRVLEIAFQFFVSTFVGRYSSCNLELSMFWPVCLDFFHATDFGGSEHSEEKVYEVSILFDLSWSTVSIGTGAASYKRLVQVSPILGAY